MQFQIGDFCSLSSGVKVWCTSDDFVNDLVTIIPPDVEQVKKHLMRGNVTLDNYTAVGSNSVVLPGNHMPEGTAIGALSFVPAAFEFRPWSVYTGIPIRNNKHAAKQFSNGPRLRSNLGSRHPCSIL
jgi:acetyltransferase-like isoleucine patch superfamily enzyme